MHPFQFFSPTSLQEAIDLLLLDGDRQLIAGGTDLIVEIKEKIRCPDFLIDLSKISDLAQFAFDPVKGLTIGPLTRVRTVEQSELVREHYPALQQAASQLGSIQIRNRATIIGNICRASPSADTPPPLIASDALVTIHGPGGKRELPLEQFFLGPAKTALKRGEIVTKITLPSPAKSAGVYLKLGRRKAMELATAGVAVSLTKDNEICRRVRIVLGAVAPTPMRAKAAELIVEGNTFSTKIIQQAADQAMTESSPISDVRSSAQYRREMVGVLTRQGLEEAWQLAGEKQ